MTSEVPRVSVVVPAYNEGEHILPVLDRVFEAVRLPFCSALARGHCGLVPTAATLQCRHSIGMFSLL